MNPLMGLAGGAEEGTNLFSIIVNLIFGFVAGLMLFIGPQEVIDYGSQLTEKFIKLTGLVSKWQLLGLLQPRPHM